MQQPAMQSQGRPLSINYGHTKMFFAEDLIRNNEITPFFDISEPEKSTVVLGRSRTIEGDVNEKECLENNVSIIKRVSGGGTVLLSPGMLVWTLIVPTTNFCINQTIWFKIFSNWIIDNLSKPGIQGTETKGTSDITINNRKICGTSLYIGAKKVLYHGTLLLDIDTSLFDKYLKIPDRMPEYRNNRIHSEFVTTLKELGYNIGRNEILRIFNKSIFPTENNYHQIKPDKA
jgi:lipoate---protein ligase